MPDTPDVSTEMRALADYLSRISEIDARYDRAFEKVLEHRPTASNVVGRLRAAMAVANSHAVELVECLPGYAEMHEDQRRMERLNSASALLWRRLQQMGFTDPAANTDQNSQP